MEGTKTNGPNGSSNGSASSPPTTTPQQQEEKAKQPAAKSIINIGKDRVTIESTGQDGSNSNNNTNRRTPSPRVTPTPLRSRTQQDPSLAGSSPVSARIRDTQFVTALNQQFQANGKLAAPGGLPGSGGPTTVTTTSSSSTTPSSRASHSRSSSGSSSGVGEDLTSKLSSMLIQQQQQQQQQQFLQQQRKLQQRADASQTGSSSSGDVEEPVPGQRISSPPVLENGVASSATTIATGTSTNTTTTTTNGRGSGASSPEIPPAPPSSALVRSISEQPAQLRKVDASYTPRPKSYSTQTPAATGGGSPQVHNKHDLMAALTAVVTTGSPVAGLRKTRGPGRGGGVTEVFASKKTSGGSGTSPSASSPRQEKN